MIYIIKYSCHKIRPVRFLLLLRIKYQISDVIIVCNLVYLFP